MVKLRYVLFKHGDNYYIIKRITGGSTVGRYTIKEYEIVYPTEVQEDVRKKFKRIIRGYGNTLPTAFNKKKFTLDLNGIVKNIFEDQYFTL